MPKSGRPKVRLTVARIEGERLNPLQTVKLDRVLARHSRPILDHLAYACLECGSIGECVSQEARDGNVRLIDYTCCHPSVTVIFRTEEV